MSRPAQGYRNAAGERVPGVTTIIGRFKDSGPLLWWAYAQGQANERGEIDGLYAKRDEAADIGTMVHSLVEAHVNGIVPDWSLIEKAYSTEQLSQIQSGYDAYLKWESMTKLEIVEQEMSLVSEEYHFAGTPDAIGKIDNELCLLDWKTSKSVYVDMLMQLAAYQILWDENRPDEPLTGGFHLCKFSKEHGDFSHHYWPNLDDAKEQFLLFRRAYDLDKQLKARAA